MQFERSHKTLRGRLRAGHVNACKHMPTLVITVINPYTHSVLFVGHYPDSFLKFLKGIMIVHEIIFKK